VIALDDDGLPHASLHPTSTHDRLIGAAIVISVPMAPDLSGLTLRHEAAREKSL
jgi:hypothetical protein